MEKFSKLKPTTMLFFLSSLTIQEEADMLDLADTSFLTSWPKGKLALWQLLESNGKIQ